MTHLYSDGAKAKSRSILAIARTGAEDLARITCLTFYAVNSNKQANVSARFAVLAVVIEFFQILAFALAPSVSFPWQTTYIGWLADLSKALRPDILAIGTSPSARVPIAAVVVAAALVLIVGALGVASAYFLHKISQENGGSQEPKSTSSRFGRQDADPFSDFVSNSLVLRAFRQSGLLLYTVLYIPVTRAPLAAIPRIW